MQNELLRDYARLLYTSHSKTIKEISLELDVDEATLRHWAGEDNWEAVKRSVLTSNETQLEHLYNIISHLNEQLKDPEQLDPRKVDMMLKYSAMIKNLEPEISASLIIQVTAKFVKWLLPKDPGLTRKFIKHLNIFVNQRRIA